LGSPGLEPILKGSLIQFKKFRAFFQKPEIVDQSFFNPIEKILPEFFSVNPVSK
jgi:hypothetical protein